MSVVCRHVSAKVVEPLFMILVPYCTMVGKDGDTAPQVFGLPAVMVYLELSLFAFAMALCVGIATAGLAAWGTSKSTEEAPVRLMLLRLIIQLTSATS